MSLENIIIQPVGKVSNQDLLELKKGLLNFNYEIKIVTPVNLPNNGFNEKRNQYLASEFLKIAKKLPAKKVLSVTDVDLFAPNLNFVFGQAQINGKCAVISLFRLKEYVSHKIFVERMIKEAVQLKLLILRCAGSPLAKVLGIQKLGVSLLAS